MNSNDIRWLQRFENFQLALTQLREAVDLFNSRSLTKLEEQGLIQSFEYTHELAWNVIKDYFKEQGNTSITGSKDAAREAFQKGLISDGANWMEMIKSRNATSHTYNQAIAKDIVNKIITLYYKSFSDFELKMKSLAIK